MIAPTVTGSLGPANAFVPVRVDQVRDDDLIIIPTTGHLVRVERTSPSSGGLIALRISVQHPSPEPFLRESATWVASPGTKVLWVPPPVTIVDTRLALDLKDSVSALDRLVDDEDDLASMGVDLGEKFDAAFTHAAFNMCDAGTYLWETAVRP